MSCLEGCRAPLLSHQLIVLVARLRGEAGLKAGLPLRGLAGPLALLLYPTIRPRLPLLLVEHRVQLPRARVRRAVIAAQIRRVAAARRGGVRQWLKAWRLGVN